MSLNNDQDTSRFDQQNAYPSLPAQPSNQIYQHLPQSQVHPVMQVQTQPSTSASETYTVDLKQRVVKRNSACIQIWAYLMCFGGALGIFSNLGHIAGARDWEFEWQGKEGEEQVYTFDSRSLYMIFFLGIIGCLLQIKQADFTFKAIEPVLKEYKEAERSQSQQIIMSRRSKHTALMIRYIKQVLVALIFVGFIQIICINSVAKKITHDFIDEFYDIYAVNGTLNVTDVTIESGVTDTQEFQQAQDAIADQRADMSTEDRQKMDKNMQDLNDWLESLDQQEAKDQADTLINTILFMAGFFSLIGFAIYQGIYLCVLKKIQSAQEYLEIKFMGPENANPQIANIPQPSIQQYQPISQNVNMSINDQNSMI